jgi:cell division protein FtsB
MPAAPARRASARPVLPAIRWDRVGRCALLAVFVGIVLLYMGPARSLFQAVGQSKARNAEVRRLERENQRLTARKRALQRPGTMEREARRLGYVKPGERAYVIRDLPK